MAKKKLSLKPVQRGVATTSTPSRKPQEKPDEVNEPENGSPAKNEGGKTDTVAQAGLKDFGASASNATGAAENGTDNWESEEDAERVLLEGLVGRLHQKGINEVSRIMKTIEFERRLAKSFPKLDVNADLRDKIISMAMEEEEDTDASNLPSAASATDKVLLRHFTAMQVLSNLGFSDARIWERLEHLGQGTWEEALEWLWLHCSEDECLGKGQFEKKDFRKQILDEPLVPTQAHEIDVPNLANAPDRLPGKRKPKSKAPATAVSASKPMFRSAGSEDEESDSESDLSDVNEKWAHIRLKEEDLRIKRARKKELVLNEDDSDGFQTLDGDLKKDVAAVESNYLFDRKRANAILKALRERRKAKDLETRLKRTVIHDSLGIVSPNKAEIDSSQQSSAQSGGDSSSTSISESEEDNLFGNLMDEPETKTEAVLGDKEDANSLVTIRNMPIPHQFHIVSQTPKALLQSALKKSSQQIALTYARISGGSRAIRAGVEVRWAADDYRVWRMTDVACTDIREAENYIATFALHELLDKGKIANVAWKMLPPAYRELWEELEKRSQQIKLEENMATWKGIKDLIDRQIEASRDGKAGIRRALPGDDSESEGTIFQPPNREFSQKLKDEFEKRQASTSYQSMLQSRESLPIASWRQTIIDTINHSQIVVVAAETGAGKSTQLPSYILEDQLSQGKSCKIFVTEPRRISAISLAQRVSQELGYYPGAVDNASSSVGYAVRLESKITPDTRLAFVTTGVALRMLENNKSAKSGSGFDEITHLVIDEVHERSIESDFLLIIVRSLLRRRRDLKIVLMSATLDSQKISAYFDECPILNIPGRTFPVDVRYLEDAIELTGWRIDDNSPYAIWDRNKKGNRKQLEWTEEGAKTEGSDSEDEASANYKLSSANYSASTVSTVNSLDSRQIPYDLILILLERLCTDPTLQPFSAAILVFMPGIAEIRKMHEMIQTHPGFDPSNSVIYPLHSTISTEGQGAVFDIPPKGVRKIVISTNIAETGVTIPDITCVIDTGKHREMRYDERRQLSRLVETYISRSNAKQRRGRAGRVQEGLAFHLFTRLRHDTQMAEHPIPEIQRLSLQDLGLRIKVLNLNLGGSIEQVLSRALDPPSFTNIQRAVAALVEVKALTPAEEITPLGVLLSKLPMDVHLGKFLLISTVFKCLDSALTIAAALNGKSPFIAPFGMEKAAEAAKKALATGHSDFLTLLYVFNTWRDLETQGSARIFCKRNFLSYQNLLHIEEQRQQLLSLLVDSSIISMTSEERRALNASRYSRSRRVIFCQVPIDVNVNAAKTPILQAALNSGMYPKLLTWTDDGKLRTVLNQQPIAFHPSSVNFKATAAEINTKFLTYYTIMQSKRVYAWETGPAEDLAIVLLCGDQCSVQVFADSLSIDRKIRFNTLPKTALALSILRQRVAGVMSRSFRKKAISEKDAAWLQVASDCLASIETHP